MGLPTVWLNMRVVEERLGGVKLIESQVFRDERGFFLESYNFRAFSAEAYLPDTFVQENHSRSEKNVLRGLHYQLSHPQGKLVRVVNGEIYDVVVDLRKSSPTFGRWTSFHLSSSEFLSLWVPVGFAHGFLSLKDNTDVVYKTTDYYDPSSEYCLRWDDPSLKIDWPLESLPLISKKDRLGKAFSDAPYFP